MVSIVLLIFFYGIVSIDGTHFRGGIISWRALNTTPSGATAQFLIYQRYSWRRSFSAATICPTLGGFMSVTGYTLTCYYGSCNGWPSNVPTDVYCTDYQATIDYSSGERYDTVTLTLGTNRSVGFYDSAWLALAYGQGLGYWSVMNLLNAYVRPDGFINTSPVTTTLPVIYKTVNVQHVHVIPMADADGGDVLKCRWAVGGPTNGNPAASSNPVQHVDECGSAGVCQLPIQSIPGSVLYGSNCTLVFTLAPSQVGRFYVVALQIEDFYSATSTTPMSSVPIQFLFYAVNVPTGCTIPPSIIGVRPNRACIGAPFGSNVSEQVIAQPGCTSVNITGFETSSPKGLTKSAIVYDASAGAYTITLSWSPTAQQAGPQGFCAAAIDSLNQQSDPWCITFIVGADSPNLNRPVVVQGSASPLGTVFANQSVFSIQATKAVHRPSLNGTNIYFNDAATNQSVLHYDAGYASNILYSGNTIFILVLNFTWTFGHSYYITMDEGFSSGIEFCGLESIKITDPTFWTFDIWDPGYSSTTSTTSTPPTTATQTTRSPSTTSVNTLLTTTGIVLKTTSQTTSTTTVTVTNATATPLPDVNVFTPEDFEQSCKIRIAVFTAIEYLVIVPLHAASIYALFLHMSNSFSTNLVQQKLRLKKRLNRNKSNIN